MLYCHSWIKKGYPGSSLSVRDFFLVEVSMLSTAHNIFKVATLCYLAGSVLSWILSALRMKLLWIFWFPALLANVAVVSLRYYITFPMLPMYLSPVALPLCLGFVSVLSFLFMNLTEADSARKTVSEKMLFLRLVMSVTAAIALTSVCFPKDFYLPFLKSTTLWAHFFLLFGIAGKSSFIAGSLWAFTGQNYLASTLSFRWCIWGFAFWTLSMFSGEIWSYTGWGTPVVWDDPAITTTMATWFFYICFLHLHLAGTWSVRARRLYAATGLIVVLLLNYLPDLGPFRAPF